MLDSRLYSLQQRFGWELYLQGRGTAELRTRGLSPRQSCLSIASSSTSRKGLFCVAWLHHRSDREKRGTTRSTVNSNNATINSSLPYIIEVSCSKPLYDLLGKSPSSRVVSHSCSVGEVTTALMSQPVRNRRTDPRRDMLRVLRDIDTPFALRMRRMYLHCGSMQGPAYRAGVRGHGKSILTLESR
jgi:hypothetical protein